MSRPKLRIKTGDRVMVMTGKDKGRRGEVLRTLPRTGKLIIERINIVKKHQRATREMMQGGIIEQPAPMDASNVMLLCRNCGEPTRVGTRTLSSGRKVRYCKKCGENIDR
ncbi:MAG: 50S ribosomal protein L24 [Bacillota bacterium]